MGKTKRILSFFIALIMVLALVPFNAIVYAVDVETGDEAQTQAPSVKEPTKQPVEPVEDADLVISTYEDLVAFAAAVNSGNSFEGKVVVLANDIDLRDEEGFVADGVVIGTSANPFKGTFDGQNHTISELYIGGYEDDMETFADSCVGLFGVIQTPAVVKNVTVNNPFIVGKSYVGGIVGMAYTGAIYNCHVTGEIDIEGYYMVGGITGHGYAKIENCSVIGDYDFDYNYIGATYKEANFEGDNVGGIVGHKAENTTIKGCTVANVTVEGTRKVGGIVGTTFQNNTITDCKVSNVTVGTNATVEYANANLSSMGLGGIIGITADTFTGGTVSNCSVNGLSFTNANNVPVSQGAITGGHRQTSGQLPVAPEGTKFVGNTAGNVVGANNEFVECGALKVELPTATVAPIQNNSNVLFGLTFSTDSVTAEQLEAYGDYFADFVITFNKDLTLGCGEGTDGWLSGNYGDYGWINVPTDGKTISVEANKSYRVMDIAAELLGNDNLHITYDFVVEFVQEFQCGVYLTPEFIAENPDFGVEIGLSMFEPVEDENGNTVLGEEIKVECTDANGAPMQTTFTSKDISLVLPSAKVYPVVNPDLSFGLTFEVNKITDAQLDYYGDWYADFTIEFSVPGSDLTEIVLGTGEGADGWLSGQYDEWSENWVNVPFENKSIPLNEPIKVMDFAAKLMGKDGLKITYREVYEGVEKFNCGVYLTPEFIEANGNFTVAVDLAMFEAVVDENGNVTEVKHDVVYTDKGGNVIDKSEVTLFDKDDVYVAAVAEVNGVKYADIQEAIKAAAPSGTVTLLSDVTVEKWIMISETLTIGDGTVITLDMNGLTIDGNGHTLTINKVESSNNGDHIFYDGDYNIYDLTLVMGDNVNGLGITSGTIKNVTFNGGIGASGGAAIMVSDGIIADEHAGNVTIEGCTFKNNGQAIYFESAQNGLVVNKNTFEIPAGANVILLRGNEKFTNNTVISGRTVNVISGSPVVTGNNFGDVRLKVYNVATATITGNTINNLVFNDATVAKSTFADNTLSASAQAALDAVAAVYVAQIGDTKYATLGEAMAALKDGDTLTLLADIDGASVQFIEFNGKKNITITAAQGVVINGSIQVGYHVSHTDSGVDRSESTFTVDGLTVTGTLTVNSNDKNVVVKNCAAAQITVKTYTMNGMNITIDKNVADGSMGTAAKNYGMYLVPNATDYNLVVSNNTFKNIDSHAFAVQGYGDGAAVTAANSIAITGNTFESWGLGGSSNRAAFKIWADTKYAPEASDLNNTTIAMRELVATTAASGNNTYLSTASNTVEYDAFGAAGDAEDFPAAATYVAQIGNNKYETLYDAIKAAKAGDKIVLLADADLEFTDNPMYNYIYASEIDLGGFTLTIKEGEVRPGNDMIIKNGNIVLEKKNYSGTAVIVLYGSVTLTLDGVNLDANGASGTYILGLENATNLNIVNSEIIVENESLVNLTAAVACNGTGLTTIKNSKVSVSNINGRAFLGGSYVVENSDIDATGVKAGFYIRANQSLEIKGTSTVDISNLADGYTDGIYLANAEVVYTKADTASVNSTVTQFKTYVAQIGDNKYETLEDALNAAQAGDEVILLADVAEDVTVPAGVIFNGNGKQVGVITAAGEITFKGHTKTTNFGVQYTNTTINIIEGACLELTGTGRMVIGHGCTFNITGTVTDAKTADKANITPSLIAAGASFTGAGVNFNVTNAYVKFTAYCSSKNSSANGTFNFDVENSIWEQTGSFVFSEPTSGKDPTFNLTLKNSVLDSTSHLVFAVAKGEIVFDNSNVNVGASRQIENRSTLTIKNGSVVNGAVATSSNAKNPGTIIVENATYAVTGEFTGSDVGTGTLVIKKGANITIGKITKANIVIDATDMVAGEIANFTANLSAFAGELSVINNDKLEAKIVDGKIVLSAKPVAKIGDTKYETLEDAIAAAKNGDEVVILVAGTYTVPSGKDITITGAVDGVVFDNIKKHAMGGASVTFNNVTFNYSMTEGHNGLQHSGKLVYNNCTFKGQVFLYGTSETFNNCTFNQTDVNNYNVWTYAADDVKFNGCTFYSAGRSLLIYSEGADLYANVVITDCDFISSNAVDGKAAIEMDSSLSAGIKVTIDAATTATGFGNGNVSGNSLWNNKKGNETAANNDITVVVNGVTVLAPVTYVAQIGNKKYTSLQDAIDAAQAGDVIVVLEDIELDTTIVVAAGKELTIDLNGKTISYTSTVQGEAMITNKGNLTINDSAETETKTGVINYNYVGAADSTYGKGNYTISNAGTLTVNGGEITIANLSGHAKYPIDNNSTTGDAILVINGGHLYNYNTSAIRMFCNSTTYKNSVTINGGLIEGYSAIWVQNPSRTSTVNGQLTIADGEIRTTAKAYVNGTAALKDVASSVHFTTEGGAWSDNSFITISGGVFNENVNLSEGAPATINVDEEKATFNGRLVLPMIPVASVNGVEYGSLQDAINAAQNGETVVLLENITLTEGVTVTGTVTLDLNGKTISTSIESTITKSFALITNRGTLTIKGDGKISVAYSGASFGYSIGLYTISNAGGTLNVEGGRIENLATVSGSMYDAIDNNSTLGNTVLNISGGDIYCAYIAIRQFANSTTGVNAVNVTGGKIEGGNCSIWTQNPGSTQPKASIAIEDGNFTGRILVGTSDNFAAAITGGTFDTDVSAFCADGYVCVAKGVGTYGVVEAPKYNITIAGKTLSLDAAIQVNLYFAKASFAGADEIYAVVQVGTKEAYVIKYGEDGWAVGQDGYAYDALNIKGIAAKEMGDVIRVQFYVGNPDDEVADVKASNEITYSVKEYAYTVIGLDNQPLEAKQSMYALLKYGAAAQKYFKYNTENLVDADLTEAMDEAYATSDAAVTKTQVFIKGQEYRLGNTMSLDDSPVLNYYFNTFHKDEYRGKIYATATYIGWDNQEHVITIKADEIVYDTVKGQTLVAIKGLSGADVSSDITLRVFAENGETLFESVYSIEAYLKAAMGAYVSDVYLYQALANYGATASAYLKKINDIK